jgi:hypothetical protein
MMATSINHLADDAVRRACALPNSGENTNIREIWGDLKRSHRLSRQQDNELPEFPYWITERVPDENIKTIITEVYGGETNWLKFRGPVVYKTFDVEDWQVLLFFGNIHQSIARELGPFGKYHKKNKLKNSICFDDFYRKVKQIRDLRLRKKSTRSRQLKNVLEFAADDFRSYC